MATLTSVYNARPQWLADAQVALGGAVGRAYGSSADVSDDEILCESLSLNGCGRLGWSCGFPRRKW